MRLIGPVKGLNFDSDLKQCPLAKVRESGIDFADSVKFDPEFSLPEQETDFSKNLV